MEKKYKKVDDAHIGGIPPTLIEKFCGYLSILIYISQIGYKFVSGKGVFLLNPCHVMMIVQSYLLLTKKDASNNTLYANFISNLFSPWCGIVFSVNVGLDLPYEAEMYWVEHFMGALINPLALVFGERYRSRQYFDFGYRLIGFALFSLYHRVVLLPISVLTWANLDQALCHALTDPFYPLFEKWYYLMADVYVSPGSFVFSYAYLIAAEVIYFVMDIIRGKKVKTA